MVLAVVKSNAYGLGAVPISKALEKAGTEWFGVTCANEGIELRESGIRKRILVLTGFWPGEERRLLENYLTPTVTRVDDLRYLERAAKNLAHNFLRASDLPPNLLPVIALPAACRFI
jgi:alanine racemase